MSVLSKLISHFWSGFGKTSVKSMMLENFAFDKSSVSGKNDFDNFSLLLLSNLLPDNCKLPLKIQPSKTKSLQKVGLTA